MRHFLLHTLLWLISALSIGCDPFLELFRGGDPATPATGDRTPSPGPIHSDPFDEPTGAWTPSPRAAVTGGAMTVSEGPAPMITWLPHRIVNGSFAATATWSAGDPSKTYGLVFRQADTTNAFRFLVSRSGDYSLLRTSGGRTELLGGGSDPAIVTGGRDRLEVSFCGYLVECSVNGEALVHACLDTIFPGQVGLFAGEGQALSFDDVALFDHDLDPGVHGRIRRAGLPAGGRAFGWS